MNVTNRSTCSIDLRVVTDYFDKNYMIWCKNAKISARSLRSLVIIYEILKSQIYFFDKGHYHEYYRQKCIIIPT